MAICGDRADRGRRDRRSLGADNSAPQPQPSASPVVFSDEFTGPALDRRQMECHRHRRDRQRRATGVCRFGRDHRPRRRRHRRRGQQRRARDPDRYKPGSRRRRARSSTSSRARDRHARQVRLQVRHGRSANEADRRARAVAGVLDARERTTGQTPARWTSSRTSAIRPGQFRSSRSRLFWRRRPGRATSIFSREHSITDWHVYSMTWTPAALAFAVDGQEAYRVTRATVEEHGRWTYDTPKHLIVNQAIGGGIPQAVNGANAPYPRGAAVDGRSRSRATER